LYATTTYAYDSRNLLTTVTDNAGNVTTLTYDGLGRKTGMSDPDMGVWTYAYDIWGQLDTQTDARGAQVNFTYDILGRVTERKARMSANNSWSSIATYTYDSTTGGNKGIGRLTSSTSPAASDTITYDLLGRVTTTTRTIDSVNYTTSMTYDSLGRVLTTTLPTSEVVTSTYNARGLFESMSGTDTYVTSTAYTPTGGIDQQLLGNAVTTTFEYYPTTNRLKRITASKIPANPLIDLSYTYDTGGNITQIVDASWVNGASRNETTTYGYDFLNRLLSADVVTTGTSTYLDQRDYAYNPIGNMTSFTLNNGTPTTYAYPSGSQPITRPHAVSSRDIPNTSNDDSFSYDANGNMTSRTQNGVTWTQTFDAENRLVSVSDGTITTQYVYDGSGSRVKRIVGSTTTLYVAGMEIKQVSGTETQRTIYYPAGGAFRVIVVSPASNTLYYRHSDHLGSTSVLSDSTGAKVTGSDVVYAPFGVIRAGSESNLTDFGYTGQRHDDNTGGLMYYGARYYLPDVMRFISADTITPGISSQALNRYSYALNRPVNFNDPTGHIPTGPMIDGEFVSANAVIVQTVAAANNPWLEFLNTQADIAATYGVLVEVDRKVVSAEDATTVIEVAEDTISTIADKTKATIDAINDERASAGQKPLNYGSGTAGDAFKAVFGPTAMHVCATESDCGLLKYGYNTGPNTHGVTVIKMFLGGFVDLGKDGHPAQSNDAQRAGQYWVAHEIGHNLTPAYNYEGTTYVYDLESYGIREDLIVPQSGDHLYIDPGELTGDIIAAWAFGAYQPGAAGNAFSQHVNTWMSGQIASILSVSATP